MSSDEETELTLWANGVADVLDGKERPELAVLFRALARGDVDLIQETVDLYTLPVLDGLWETLDEERSERRGQGQVRFSEILDEVLTIVDEARSRRLLEDVDWDEEDTLH